MGGLAAASIVMLVAGSCGDDSDEGVATADDAEEVSDAHGTGGQCLLDADAASDAIGVDVVFDSLTFGGTSGTARVRAYVDPDTTEIVTEDPSYSVSWQGCTYLADDGAEFMTDELVDEDSNPDASGFDQLHGLATTEAEEPALPDVGDEAFFGHDELVVRTGDHTLVLGFTPGFLPDSEDMAALVDVGAAAVDAGVTDIGAVCETARDLAPDTWQPIDPTPLLGSGGTMIDGVDHSYETCYVTLQDGAADLDIKLGQAELFDAWRDPSDDALEDPIPEVAEGIGDAAVWMSDRLYFNVGDRGFTTSGLTAGEDPADREQVEALAQATVTALG